MGDLAQAADENLAAHASFIAGRIGGRVQADDQLVAVDSGLPYNISTLPPYRGRGIGAAMTHRPLVDARAEGWRTAILQAADAGLGLYRRLGFTPFGDITEFKPV